jgi:hypothetical protein
MFTLLSDRPVNYLSPMQKANIKQMVLKWR